MLPVTPARDLGASDSQQHPCSWLQLTAGACLGCNMGGCCSEASCAILQRELLPACPDTPMLLLLHPHMLPDPAAEAFNYPVSIDIRDLVSLDDVMEDMQLGPNG